MRLLCLILTTLPWSIKSECQPWCLVSGWKCDDVSAKCLCDFDDRNVEWCLDGQSQSPFYSLHQASKLHLDFDDLHYLEITSKNKLKHVDISVYGISRRAVAIVGLDGYLTLAELSDCIFEEENDLGLSLWLRYGDSYDQILFTIGGNTRNTSRMLMYLNSSNPESLFVDFQAGNKSTSYTFTVPWNIWTYVALSWNASEQSLTVMINGELIDTLSYVVCFGCASEVDNKQIVLGKSPDVNSQFTNVFFDELAVYCKPLGLEEVKSNYTFYKGLPGLQANYTLLFPSLIWKTAEQSLEYIGLSDLQETLYSEISDFYSSRDRKEVFKDTWIYQCKNMMGRVSCDIGVTLMSTDFNSIYILNSAIKWNWLNFSAEISTFANNDVPSKLVKLEGVALGNSSILIQWTNLPEALLNGILQGFKISYTHELRYSVTTEMVYRYINNFTLSNLEWYTTHYIKFFVLTLEGQGVVNYLNVKTGMIGKDVF
ncbi:uncharacterized protein LOC125556778 [Nematostella vectensis]|uniref:uncharacterized protein LOC125556778 n=1 Tax=Nematostella vectensis TaxID=45351 RepID=UPI002076E121|nr:uncharacterized protein LOC125556778 [Nematostella vectensis]